MSLASALDRLDKKYAWSLLGFVLAVIFGALSIYTEFIRDRRPQLRFEIISEENVSLAGAINKFARSDLRKQLDDEYRELCRENSDEGRVAREADNFASIKEDIKRFSEEQRFWEDVIASKDWNDFEKSHLSICLLHAADQLGLATRRYGPFLMWADQVDDRERTDAWRAMEEFDAQRLRSEIELGKLRRKSRSN